jgi:hypothetical protein
MLTNVPWTLVNKANREKPFWNLCSQPLENVRGVIFYA